MSEHDILQKSRLLAEKLFHTDLYRRAQTVYGYLSYNQEVRMVPVLEQALRDGKRVAVPRIFGDTMRFLYIEDFSAVIKGYAGIPEPMADSAEANDPTALVIVPGLAFDLQGHRVGYGGGFYDRFLAKEPEHPTVALCYDFQILPQIRAEEFDIPVDLVLWA